MSIETTDADESKALGMLVNNATLTVFKSQGDAEAALRQLARGGYDLGKVSMVAREGDGITPGPGHSNDNGRGSAGVSWGGIKGMLVGSGLFVVPGIGSLVVAGPLLKWIVRAMGTVIGPDKLDAMAAGLIQLGIPRASILRCEDALKSGKVILVAEGSAMAMILAREILRRTPVEVIEQHVRLPS
jgi:hypothetical protein